MKKPTLSDQYVTWAIAQRDIAKYLQEIKDFTDTLTGKSTSLGSVTSLHTNLFPQNEDLLHLFPEIVKPLDAKSPFDGRLARIMISLMGKIRDEKEEIIFLEFCVDLDLNESGDLFIFTIEDSLNSYPCLDSYSSKKIPIKNYRKELLGMIRDIGEFHYQLQ